VVDAVLRWVPYPLDAGLLALDDAAAKVDAGRLAEATAILSSEATTDRLQAVAELVLGGTDLTSDEHVVASRQSAHALLADVHHLVELAVTMEGADGRFGGLSRELNAERSLRERDRARLLEVLVSKGLTSQGRSRFKRGEITVLQARIDLAVVPPRVFSWLGADVSDIEYDVIGSGVAVSAAIIAPTKTELIAFAAAPDGQVLAQSMMAPSSDSSRMTAVLDLPGTQPSGVVLGLRSAEIDPQLAALRAVDPAVDAERHLIESWSRSRFAVSTLVAEQVSDSPPTTRWLDVAPSELVAGVGSVLGRSRLDEAPRRRAELADYQSNSRWDQRASVAGAARPLISEFAFVLGAKWTA
jgi:hypothetical protein